MREWAVIVLLLVPRSPPPPIATLLCRPFSYRHFTDFVDVTGSLKN